MVALLAAFAVAALFQSATASGALDAIDRDARAGVCGNVEDYHHNHEKRGRRRSSRSPALNARRG